MSDTLLSSAPVASASTGSGLPRAPLLAMAALVVATVLGVAAMRWSGAPTVSDKPAAVVTERLLRFVDRSDGGVDVLDVQQPERNQVVLPGGDGFLRATLRTLARERKRQGVGAEPPFKLSELADGRLILEDPTIGRRVDLEAFGPTNAQRFARLLNKPAGPVAPVASVAPAGPVLAATAHKP